MHLPEKFGDDLSSFRHTIVKSNAERVAVTGLEAGVSGLGICGMVPVFHQGKHIDAASRAMAAAGTQVVDGSSAQSEAASAVAAAVEETSVSISETASNAQSADELAGRAQAGIEAARAAADTARQLDEMANRLRDAVGQFRV